MVPSVTRVIGSLLPARPYHWLVVRVASLPGMPARRLRHSVVFRRPLRPGTEHYVLVPTEYAPSVLGLPASTARRLQEDIVQWVAERGWSFAQIVVNFGAYQETPFLHVHLMPGETPPESGLTNPDWLTVDLENGAGAIQSGRRVVRYDAAHNLAQATTEMNRR